MTTHSTRRSFLKTSLAFAGSTWAAPQILAQSAKGANDRIRLAWIGLGMQGQSDLSSCGRACEVVALCDCDSKNSAKPVNQHQKRGAKYYQDFRKMFEEMGDRIDAVGISTPDHIHFPAAYMAVNLGKHVFVQKPLTHSLWEARTLTELATKKGVVTQMGNQGHAYEGARLGKEWDQAGLVGAVKEVIAWSNRPAHKGNGFVGKVFKEFAAAQPVPEHLDWNLWMGPVAKDIGYSGLLHPRNWRAWWDFGCGGLGDMGCHTIDSPFWAMDLGLPESVEVKMNDEVNPIYTPYGSVVSFNFPARGDKPPVTLKWYEGPTPPVTPKDFEYPVEKEGGLIMVGEKGGISHGARADSPKLYPAKRWEDYRANPGGQVPKTLSRVKGGLHADWLNAIREGRKACSDFSYAGPLTEIILLGTLAIRTGKGFKLDGDATKILGNPEAAALVKIEARKGWDIKDLT